MIKLLKDKYFSNIFKGLLLTGEIQEMLLSDKTTGKNGDRYVEVAESFFEVQYGED